jgi:hypothetical protein
VLPNAPDPKPPELPPILEVTPKEVRPLKPDPSAAVREAPNGVEVPDWGPKGVVDPPLPPNGVELPPVYGVEAPAPKGVVDPPAPKGVVDPPLPPNGVTAPEDIPAPKGVAPNAAGRDDPNDVVLIPPLRDPPNGFGPWAKGVEDCPKGVAAGCPKEDAEAWPNGVGAVWPNDTGAVWPKGVGVV